MSCNKKTKPKEEPYRPVVYNHLHVSLLAFTNLYWNSYFDPCKYYKTLSHRKRLINHKNFPKAPPPTPNKYQSPNLNRPNRSSVRKRDYFTLSDTKFIKEALLRKATLTRPIFNRNNRTYAKNQVKLSHKSDKKTINVKIGETQRSRPRSLPVVNKKKQFVTHNKFPIDGNSAVNSTESKVQGYKRPINNKVEFKNASELNENQILISEKFNLFKTEEETILTNNQQEKLDLDSNSILESLKMNESHYSENEEDEIIPNYDLYIDDFENYLIPNSGYNFQFSDTNLNDRNSFKNDLNFHNFDKSDSLHEKLSFEKIKSDSKYDNEDLRLCQNFCPNSNQHYNRIQKESLNSYFSDCSFKKQSLVQLKQIDSPETDIKSFEYIRISLDDTLPSSKTEIKLRKNENERLYKNSSMTNSSKTVSESFVESQPNTTESDSKDIFATESLASINTQKYSTQIENDNQFNTIDSIFEETPNLIAKNCITESDKPYFVLNQGKSDPCLASEVLNQPIVSNSKQKFNQISFNSSEPKFVSSNTIQEPEMSNIKNKLSSVKIYNDSNALSFFNIPNDTNFFIQNDMGILTENKSNLNTSIRVIYKPENNKMFKVKPYSISADSDLNYARSKISDKDLKTFDLKNLNKSHESLLKFELSEHQAKKLENFEFIESKISRFDTESLFVNVYKRQNQDSQNQKRTVLSKNDKIFNYTSMTVEKLLEFKEQDNFKRSSLENSILGCEIKGNESLTSFELHNDENYSVARNLSVKELVKRIESMNSVSFMQKNSRNLQYIVSDLSVKQIVNQYESRRKEKCDSLSSINASFRKNTISYTKSAPNIINHNNSASDDRIFQTNVNDFLVSTRNLGDNFSILSYKKSQRNLCQFLNKTSSNTSVKEFSNNSSQKNSHNSFIESVIHSILKQRIKYLINNY
jgi:hypothetical protein